MNHPMIEEIEVTGYPLGYTETGYGMDSLGNEVMEGDEILVFEDEFFLVDELTSQTIEALEVVGATHEIAH